MAAHSDTPAQALARVLSRSLQKERPTRSDADVCYDAALKGPVFFAREILKLDPWSLQCEILLAVLGCKRIAVTSGHKISKSTTAAILALWFYCRYKGGRVVITATTDNQVNGIIWREIKRLVRRAKRAGVELPGARNIHEVASSGLVDPLEFSEIKGYTAKDSEAIAGVSGPAILYLVDEASGVKDNIFEAIQGNRAGGNAWVVLTSNPTRADGENYEAHHAKSEGVMGPGGYKTFQVDSRKSPNCTGEWRQMQDWDFDAAQWVPRVEPVPGLATPEWVAEMLRDYGEDSPIFAVRVRGDFAIAEQAKLFPLALIEESEERHAATEPRGRLFIGLDPAGDGEGGDDSIFAPRQGRKMFQLRGRPGMNAAAHIAEIDDIIATYDPPESRRTGWPLPLVIYDSEGEIGQKIREAFAEHAKAHGFEVHRVRSSERAVRQPAIYDRVRDEMAFCFRSWLRDGGAIPKDPRLEKDLHALESEMAVNGRIKITDKRALRKILGRSPDSGDAAQLSTWEPRAQRGARGTPDEDEPHRKPKLDPYRHVGQADHGKTFDPYGPKR